MAKVFDWNDISPLVQYAAGRIGQRAWRYQIRETTDEVRIYFDSGWYADIDADILSQIDKDEGATLDLLIDEFARQYERHGKPNDSDPVLGQIVEVIDAHCKGGATRRDLAIFVGHNALASIQQAWCAKEITAPLCPHGGSSAPHHPRQAELVGDVEFEQSYRGEIMGVPILFDPWCPLDYWKVQRSPDRTADNNGAWDGFVVERTVEKLAQMGEDMAAERMAKLERRGRECDLNPTAVALGYPLRDLKMDSIEDRLAREEWSRRLRELQAEARRKEREQVVVDVDWP